MQIFLYLCALIWKTMCKKVILWTILMFVLLPAMAKVDYMTTADFKAKVFDYEHEKEWKFKGNKPVIIDFYTTWCGPCKRLAPIMEELSETYAGKVQFFKADTEQELELAYVFQITSIPQVLYIPVNGQPILLKGLYPKEEIIKIIDEHLVR